ncbi:MAG: sugar ABC transporter permease [Halanaerobiales bacterium]|nr:sugar ABC transporter permease [Halanaerobiales bacterium]
MKIRQRLKISLATKKSLIGYLFVLPFVIGFILFFLYPFIQSVIFSLSELKIVPDGYILEYVQFKNYNHALFINAKFSRVFMETLLRMLADVPLIIFFSLFAAMLLNQKFRGRLLVRTIFFLPVIMGAGVVLAMERVDYMTQILQSGQDVQGGFLSAAYLRSFLLQLKIPEAGLEYIITVVGRIPEIIRASGIQILIFLAGLQSIPPSLFEASRVEGATQWENFWFIILPLISPLILTNIVYTIIDSFTAAHNELLGLIRDTAFGGAGYGVSTAMANIYFLAIAVILAISIAIISKWVFYHE